MSGIGTPCFDAREDWEPAVAGTEHARYRPIIKQGAHGAAKNPPIEAGKGN